MQRHQSVKNVAHTVPLDSEKTLMDSDMTIETRYWKTIEKAYNEWYADVFFNSNGKVPTAQQAAILDLVHTRRKLEYFLEQGLPLDSELENLSTEP